MDAQSLRTWSSLTLPASRELVRTMPTAADEFEPPAELIQSLLHLKFCRGLRQLRKMVALNYLLGLSLLYETLKR